MGETKPTKQQWEIIRPPLTAKFYLPSKEDLFRIASGDAVKLIFKAGDDIERMWVRVEQCGDSMQWTGILDNDPMQDYISSALKYGDFVKFHPYDIVGVEGDSRSINAHDIEQIIDTKLSQVSNLPAAKWYKNPHIVVPALTAIFGTIVGAVVAISLAYLTP